MSGPGPSKLPISFYISRQHMAVVKAEAREKKTTNTQIITDCLDLLVQRRKRAGKKIPRPVPRYKAKWFRDQQEAKAQA